MPVKRDKDTGKIVVTWPLTRKDFFDIYSGINHKTVTKLFDEFGIPKGRTLAPSECARALQEMGLPHSDFDIRLAGVKVQVLQMELGL